MLEGCSAAEPLTMHSVASVSRQRRPPTPVNSISDSHISDDWIITDMTGVTAMHPLAGAWLFKAKLT